MTLNTPNRAPQPALFTMTRALELEPWHGVAWAALGHHKGGTVQGLAYTPVECFQKALELDPEDSATWFQLAQLGGGAVAGVEYTRQGCEEEAARHGPQACSERRL